MLASAPFPQPNVEITRIGGLCPVQGSGFINGKSFYFRARGEKWSLSIGDEPIGNPDWYYEELYGSWPDAGYMEIDDACSFIHQAARRYFLETHPELFVFRIEMDTEASGSPKDWAVGVGEDIRIRSLNQESWAEKIAQIIHRAVFDAYEKGKI